MKEIKLRINYSPIIGGRSNYAFPIMLLGENAEAEMSLITNSFINCYYNKTYFDIYEQDYFFQDSGLFERWEEFVYPHNFEKNQGIVLHFFYKCICNGFAITGHWNIKIIDESKKGCDSEFLVYGMNFKEGELYIISIEDGKPVSYIVSAEKFFNAAVKGPEELYWYCFIRLNHCNSIKVCKDKIISDYWDFVCSTNRKNVFDDGKNYGLHYLDAYINHIKQCIESGSKLNYSDAITMFDHKVCTKVRIEYLEKQEIIQPGIISENYDLVLSTFRDNLTDVLAFNKTISRDIGREIIEKMEMIKDKELMFSIDLIRKLEND